MHILRSQSVENVSNYYQTPVFLLSEIYAMDKIRYAPYLYFLLRLLMFREVLGLQQNQGDGIETSHILPDPTSTQPPAFSVGLFKLQLEIPRITCSFFVINSSKWKSLRNPVLDIFNYSPFQNMPKRFILYSFLSFLFLGGETISHLLC